MSRQIQIRRGSAAEHENFTGAIGEITMDTTNNTLRVHDGVTAGGTALAKQSELPDLSGADYVVESQLPTAQNNYTWYRKYKSGWVEQGGKELNLRWYGNGDVRTPTLPKPMQDTNYNVSATMGNHTTNWGYPGCLAWGLSTTQIKLGIAGPDQGYADVYWRVEGMAAIKKTK